MSRQTECEKMTDGLVCVSSAPLVGGTARAPAWP
jgi:hypothetical protein